MTSSTRPFHRPARMARRSDFRRTTSSFAMVASATFSARRRETYPSTFAARLGDLPQHQRPFLRDLGPSNPGPSSRTARLRWKSRCRR